eukprot:SAG31_NODE_1195_length_9445_cov_21.712711_2_plen_393_part_00
MGDTNWSGTGTKFDQVRDTAISLESRLLSCAATVTCGWLRVLDHAQLKAKMQAAKLSSSPPALPPASAPHAADVQPVAARSATNPREHSGNHRRSGGTSRSNGHSTAAPPSSSRMHRSSSSISKHPHLRTAKVRFTKTIDRRKGDELPPAELALTLPIFGGDWIKEDIGEGFISSMNRAIDGLSNADRHAFDRLGKRKMKLYRVSGYYTAHSQEPKPSPDPRSGQEYAKFTPPHFGAVQFKPDPEFSESTGSKNVFIKHFSATASAEDLAKPFRSLGMVEDVHTWQVPHTSSRKPAWRFALLRVATTSAAIECLPSDSMKHLSERTEAQAALPQLEFREDPDGQLLDAAKRHFAEAQKQMQLADLDSRVDRIKQMVSWIHTDDTHARHRPAC